MGTTVATPILADAYYTLDQCKAFRLGDVTLRRWRKHHGLTVRYVGRTAFVKGAEIIRCIEETATERWGVSK